MDQSTSSSLKALLDQAGDYRVRAKALLDKADALEKHVHGIQEIISGDRGGFRLVIGKAVEPSERKGSGGKPPGSVGTKWRGWFQYVFENYALREVSLDDLGAAIALVVERTMRPSEVKRHLGTYVDAGLMVEGLDGYSIAEAALEKLGLQRDDDL